MAIDEKKEKELFEKAYKWLNKNPDVMAKVKTAYDAHEAFVNTRAINGAPQRILELQKTYQDSFTAVVKAVSESTGEDQRAKFLIEQEAKRAGVSNEDMTREIAAKFFAHYVQKERENQKKLDQKALKKASKETPQQMMLRVIKDEFGFELAKYQAERTAAEAQKKFEEAAQLTLVDIPKPSKELMDRINRPLQLELGPDQVKLMVEEALRTRMASGGQLQPATENVQLNPGATPPGKKPVAPVTQR